MHQLTAYEVKTFIFMKVDLIISFAARSHTITYPHRNPNLEDWNTLLLIFITQYLIVKLFILVDR